MYLIKFVRCNIQIPVQQIVNFIKKKYCDIFEGYKSRQNPAPSVRRLVIADLCQLQSAVFIMLWATCFWGCISPILSGLWWGKKFNKNVNTIRCCEAISLLQKKEICPAPYLRDIACAHKHLHTLEHLLFIPVQIKRVKAKSCSYNFFHTGWFMQNLGFSLIHIIMNSKDIKYG